MINWLDFGVKGDVQNELMWGAYVCEIFVRDVWRGVLMGVLWK